MRGQEIQKLFKTNRSINNTQNKKILQKKRDEILFKTVYGYGDGICNDILGSTMLPSLNCPTYHFENGDCCVIIKSDGTIGRVVMPEMDTKMITTKGYRKLFEFSISIF